MRKKCKYICQFCKKEFWNYPRFQDGKYTGRKYCSKKCKYLMFSKRQRQKFKTDIIKLRSISNFMSVPEIAKLENCSESAVRNHFHRNKIKMQGFHSNSVIPNLTLPQKCYLAGIIDGEGSISLATNTKLWIIQITNTDKNLIKYLCSIIPQSNFCIAKSYNPNHKTKYFWRLSKQISVLQFLQQIYPYLIIKKRITKRAIKQLTSKLTLQPLD